MIRNDKTHDFLFKVVIVGDINVGKTSLLLRYTKNTFSGHYRSTIGCDFLSKSSDINGRYVSLQMWDTSGQERFHALSSSFYRHADGLIIVYDVTNMDSFTKITKWLRDADYYSGKPIRERVLIGNKTDKTTERVVSYNQAKKFADSSGLSYIETSAKDNTNVHSAFDSMTKNMIDSYDHVGWINSGPESIKLDEKAIDVPEYSGYCCSYI